MMVVLHRCCSHGWEGFYLSGLLGRSRIQKKGGGGTGLHEVNLSPQRTSCDKLLWSSHKFPVSFFCQPCHFESRLKNIWHFCHRQQSTIMWCGSWKYSSISLSWIMKWKEKKKKVKLKKPTYKNPSTRENNTTHHVSCEVLTPRHHF